jgi:4-amino-4-deoxy-L-arabinose transferase-like glycosyltransferase
MRNKVVTVLSAIGICVGSVYLANGILSAPDMGMAFLCGALAAGLCAVIIARDPSDRTFLLKLFVAALAVRWVVGYVIFDRHLQSFFGGDALSYDAFGNALCRSWKGLVDPDSPWLTRYTEINKSSGWGMYYYVAALYYVIGRNPFALQLINGALGAAVSIGVYKIAQLIYPERRVARIAAILTAFTPSLILWSSQALKDAPIVLFLCLCPLFALKLRQKFRLPDLVLLLVCLLGLFTLRHYAAYIMFVAIAGSFVLTAKRFTPLRVLQGGAMVIVIGLSLVYFGAGKAAQEGFNLKRIQSAREWGAKASNSGFGGDVDITDPEAAIGYLPVGIVYVTLAPFPWMMTNLRQLITLPELLVWWILLPVLIKGYWFAIRHRLKETFLVCVFTLGLTLAYALYQTNVGTAYRHRAQLYIFFFVFIGIGLELRRAARLKKRASHVFVRPGFAPIAAAGPPTGMTRQN